jgi:ABC-type nitrate/sulfonate/bicarbonate transport system substrate-binding protein
LRRSYVCLLASFLVLASVLAAQSRDLEKVACSEAVRGFFFVPLYVAHGLKFFEENGLDVSIVSAQGGPLAMQALVAGDVQFCATGHGQVANMYANGKSTKIVNQMQDKCTFYLVGRPNTTSIKGLKGKMIGCTKIGAETFAVGRTLAAGAGLDPEKDVTMVGVGGMATMASALDNGRVQAIVAWQPLTAKLVQEKKGVELARLNTARESEKYFGSPQYSFSVIQVTDDLIKRKPVTVQKFVNAMVKAEKWIVSHKPDEVARVVAPYFSGMAMDLVKTSVEQDKEAFSPSGIVSREGHETAVKVFAEAKILNKSVPFEAIVDNSFSEKASK